MKNYREEIKKIKPSRADVAIMERNPIFARIYQSREGRYSHTNYDSAGTAAYYFVRDLEYVKEQAYEERRPGLTGLELFHIGRSVPVGATSVAYKVEAWKGGGKIMANHANDIPVVDVEYRIFEAEIKTLKNMFEYTHDDIRASQYENMPLSVAKAKAAKGDLEEQLNRLAWVGDKVQKIKGVLSEETGIPQSTAPKTLFELTADKLNEYILSLASGINTQSRGIFSPDTLVLPPKQYDRLFDTRFAQSTDISVGKWILENNRHIKNIVQAPELMGDSGLNPFYEDCAFLFENERDNIEIEVPMMPTMRPVYQSLDSFQTVVEASSAGAIIKQPMSAIIIKGV